MASPLPNVMASEISFWERTFIMSLSRIMDQGEMSSREVTEEAASLADQAVIQRRLRLMKERRLAKRQLRKPTVP